MERAVLLSVVAACVVGITRGYPACQQGLTCTTLSPADKPGLQFECAYITPPNSKDLVYHMHGNDGLGAKGMFFELMLLLADAGFSSLACDQRGFTPGAAPDDINEYNYNIIATDIFSLVDASKLNKNPEGKFHIVAHDQGARVTWHSIALGLGRKAYLSFSTLSIPHSDVFSNALYGPTADSDQQAASQYMRMLVLPNSTSVYDYAIFNKVCRSSQEEQDTCQKILYWYNGGVNSGAMALPPLGPFGFIAKYIGIPADVVANLTQYNLSGVPQRVKVGHVHEFPVMFACGEGDSSDLCKPAFGNESGALIDKFQYLHLDSPCGHDVLGCADTAQLTALHNAIINNIKSVYQ
eukprot:m.304911 g.304911  ORF g.304911 m.304911 type:complete len:352 (+) comp16443_c1_seq2:103-1158(+)